MVSALETTIRLLLTCAFTFNLRPYNMGTGDKPMVEFHVDQIAETEKRQEHWPTMGGCRSVRFPPACAPCEYGHKPEVCKCSRPVYHLGQDESIYKAYALPKGVWKIRGACKFLQYGVSCVIIIFCFHCVQACKGCERRQMGLARW